MDAKRLGGLDGQAPGAPLTKTLCQFMMSDYQYIKVGFITAAVCTTIMILIGGASVIKLTALYIFFGWLGIRLYEIKTNTWVGLLMFKVPVNILFNPFFLILLLKSWTMLKFESDLNGLEENIK